MATMYLAHRMGVEVDAAAWDMLQIMLAHVEEVWEQPDSGIWESRAAPRHYTHSKVEAWNAFACAVKMVREFGYPGPVERWSAVADNIHAQVCARAFNPALGSVRLQSYDDDQLDASVLLLPLIDFLPAGDDRIAGTVRALERHLMLDGFLYRTTADPENRDAPSGPGEGAFLRVQLLVGRKLRAAGTPRRRARALRPSARGPQRRRARLRGVRPARAPARR